jgi:hypothetical protein
MIGFAIMRPLAAARGVVIVVRLPGMNFEEEDAGG